LIEHSRQTANLTKTQIVVLLALPTDPILYRRCLNHIRFLFRRGFQLAAGFGWKIAADRNLLPHGGIVAAISLASPGSA
jgi:hypothetical protein